MSKQHQKLCKRLCVLAVASALGIAGVSIAAVPAGGGKFATLTRATQLHRGDVVRGAMPISRTVHVTVALKLRNDAQLESFIHAQRSGARRAMSHASLAANHFPTASQAQAVATFLKHAGFTNVHVSSNRMLVSGDASAAAVQTAFKTSLIAVRTNDGRNAFANSRPIQIPAALRGSVQAVLGLQTVNIRHTLARVRPAARAGVGGHFPLEFADIYGASSLPPATDINVAVWGWGSMQASVDDLNNFTAVNGLDPVNINVVCTDTNGMDPNTGEGLGGISIGDPTCNGIADAGQVEWSMDSQSIIGMTGGVNSLTFYAANAPYSGTLTDSLNEIVTPTMGEPLAQVINASFGGCERAGDINQGGDGSNQVWDALFQIAAAQGQTFSVSTGDSGADNCGDGLGDSASSPANDPWVIAASGTTLRASDTTWARENVWVSSGGSPSSVFQAQSWQSPLTYGAYAGARGPDIAFDGNPSSGEIVLIGSQYGQVGGTSLSAPLFAGAWARILQSNPSLGFAAPHLYALPASVFHDVRSGNNRGYIARRGWDWASGRGSFDVGAAAAALSSEE